VQKANQTINFTAYPLHYTTHFEIITEHVAMSGNLKKLGFHELWGDRNPSPIYVWVMYNEAHTKLKIT
jgi:hypothetical protein